MSTQSGVTADFGGAQAHVDMLRAQIVARENAAKYHLPWMVFERDGVWYSQFEGTGPNDLKRVVYVPMGEGPYDRYVDGPATQLVTRRCEADEPGELELRERLNSARNVDVDGWPKPEVVNLLGQALRVLNAVPNQPTPGSGYQSSYDLAHAITRYLARREVSRG